jgi:hypothetical protein
MITARDVARMVTNGLRRRRIPGTEFTRWMGYVNPGMLHPGNMYLFDHCIKNLPSDAPVLEIGSFCGLSLNNILTLLRDGKRANIAFSADEWVFETAGADDTCIEGSNVRFADYRAHVMETFRRNMMLFHPDRLPHHIRLNSDAFFAAWGAGEKRTDFFGRDVQLGGPLSFAYIDGDHTYEQSLRDFHNVDKFLQVGGFIVFDDSFDWGGYGCNQTAREAARTKNYRLVARTPNYCVQKIA